MCCFSENHKRDCYFSILSDTFAKILLKVKGSVLSFSQNVHPRKINILAIPKMCILKNKSFQKVIS
jgi:hypothetical protein